MPPVRFTLQGALLSGDQSGTPKGPRVQFSRPNGYVYVNVQTVESFCANLFSN